MNFITFKNAVSKQIAQMQKLPMFVTGAPKDGMWETYLEAFPEGTNNIYRQRREFDCNCCKQFIRTMGAAVCVSNEDGLISIWDIYMPDEPEFQQVANTMSAYVKSFVISNVFLHDQPTVGTSKNFENTVDGVRTWEHFHCTLNAALVSKTIGATLGEFRGRYELLSKALVGFEEDAITTVIDLIKQGSIYRGEEHLHLVESFHKLYKEAGTSKNLDNFVWMEVSRQPMEVATFKNRVIGTLVEDLSSGMELDKAVSRFESKVAPANYKRSSAVVTASMLKAAKEKVEELGLVPSLQRRHATIDDVLAKDVLFIDRSAVAKADMFDDIAKTLDKPRSSAKVEEISIEDFINNVLPTCSSVEVSLEPRHAGKFVSVIAPSDPTSLLLFKWDNAFSWSYAGELADSSIRDKVAAAGGNVSGDICCRLAWSNYDDLDLHMVEPYGRIYFGSKTNHNCNGMLDVDMNAGYRQSRSPVENIVYKDVSNMRPGTYTLSVSQYSRRETVDNTFQVELDVLGDVYRFEGENPLSSKALNIARILHKGGRDVEVTPLLSCSTVKKTIWGVSTGQFQKVSSVMFSPNFWSGAGIGNKHYFFIIEGCKNDELPRPFYNEFLRNDLMQHRKALELIGGKVPVEHTGRELSGVGFSSTQRDELLVKVKGSFSRNLLIKF